MTATEAGAAPLDTVDRLLAGALTAGGSDLESHLAVHGPMPSARHGRRRLGAALHEEIRRSGLCGRGGAWFPTGRKWDAAAGRRPLLVVNAMEGEPLSNKEGALLRYAPHLVLDGAELAAMAVAARGIVLCVADDRPERARALESAMRQRRLAGMVWTPTELVLPPGRYVSGEESALVSFVSGGSARPSFRPDKSRPLSVRRHPALVHNAETLAHVALVARHGADWFRAVGAPDAPGTTLVSVSGAVERPGVYEVELGTPLRSVLEGPGPGHGVAAVLVGGYAGTWLHPSLLDTPFAPGPLAAVGCAMGAGILAALPAGSCGVAETARVARYMAGETAGQCGPCVFGLPAIAEDLCQLAAGAGDGRSVARLGNRLEVVTGRGACRHPDGVVRLVRSAMEVFAGDFDDHARHRPCAGHGAPSVLRFPVPVAEEWRRPGRTVLASSRGS